MPWMMLSRLRSMMCVQFQVLFPLKRTREDEYLVQLLSLSDSHLIFIRKLHLCHSSLQILYGVMNCDICEFWTFLLESIDCIFWFALVYLLHFHWVKKNYSYIFYISNSKIWNFLFISIMQNQNLLDENSEFWRFSLTTSSPKDKMKVLHPRKKGEEHGNLKIQIYTEKLITSISK